MAEIELFHYRKAHGTLHRYNGSLKLLSLVFLTISIFNSSPPGLSLLSLFVCFLFLLEYYQTKILSPLRLIQNIRGFLLFLLLITTIRGFSMEGTPLWGIAQISKEGIFAGLLYSWKLILLIILGQLITSTTDPVDIYRTVYRLLRPLPLINEGNAATMVSLTITFIPLIFDQYSEVSNAVESRLGNRNRNPMRKIISLSLPLLQTTFLRAGEITLAMESRCYNDKPTMDAISLRKSDFLLFLITILLSVIIFLFNLQV